MNIQEREQVTRFLRELVQAHAGSKDPEAERLIRENCNYQPDASYLLVQRVLLLEQALKDLEAENSKLQKDLEKAQGTGSAFLNDAAWGNSPAQPSRPMRVDVAASAPAPAAASTPVAAQAEGGHASSFLGAAATTAAGVVAGSFLFQGIEHLMATGGSGFLGGHPLSPANQAVSASTLTDQTRDFGEGASDLDALIPSDTDLGSV